MAFRINHIHLKAPDPRKTAEWYVNAFKFKTVSDEVRVFGDRFVRCLSEDGGMAVNISGARTGATLALGTRSPTTASSTSGLIPNTSRPTSRAWKVLAPSSSRGRSRSPTALASHSSKRPTTRASN